MSRIEDYALIGDLHTAAMVSTAGSVDWWCVPSLDSPACFAALLGDADAGRWSLAPAGASSGPADGGATCSSRRYVDDTLVLVTSWSSGSGTVEVIDFMPPREQGAHIVRIVHGVAGEVEMRSELRLRFDYGRVVPWVRHAPGEVTAVAGPDRVVLRSPIQARGEDWTTSSTFTVRAGDRVPFVLSWSASHETPAAAVDAEQALERTTRFWTDWVRRGTRRDGPYRDAVNRSLITLKALTYQPTGGVVAAPTTSLPEQI